MTWYFYFDVEFKCLSPKPCDATKVFFGSAMRGKVTKLREKSMENKSTLFVFPL